MASGSTIALNDCLINGTMYLGRFMLSFEIIFEMHSASELMLSLIETKALDSVRNKHK